MLGPQNRLLAQSLLHTGDGPKIPVVPAQSASVLHGTWQNCWPEGAQPASLTLIAFMQVDLDSQSEVASHSVPFRAFPQPTHSNTTATAANNPILTQRSLVQPPTGTSYQPNTPGGRGFRPGKIASTCCAPRWRCAASARTSR
jgi:hypothetical protein